MNTRRIVTSSGAVYVIRDNKFVTRTSEDRVKRGDGAEQQLVVGLPPENMVGRTLYLVMESLSPLGPDDMGTPQGEGDAYTRRTTTTVVSDETEDGDE